MIQSKPIPEIGNCQYLITLQTCTKVSDGRGGNVLTWADYKTIYSAINWHNAILKAKLDIPQNEELCTFAFRYNVNFTPTMRVSYNSKIYNFTSWQNWNNKDKWIQADAISTSQV